MNKEPPELAIKNGEAISWIKEDLKELKSIIKEMQKSFKYFYVLLIIGAATGVVNLVNPNFSIQGLISTLLKLIS